MPRGRGEPVRTDCRHMVCATADQSLLFLTRHVVRNYKIPIHHNRLFSPSFLPLSSRPGMFSIATTTISSLITFNTGSSPVPACSPLPLWHSQKQHYYFWNARSRCPCSPIFSCSHVLSRAPPQAWPSVRSQTALPSPSGLSYSIGSSCLFSCCFRPWSAPWKDRPSPSLCPRL